MRLLIALAFLLMAVLSVGMTACGETSGDVFENYQHGGYPGPAVRTENRDS